MDNNSISKVFADVAVLMQARGDNVFKVRAHSNASDAIKSLSYPITDIVGDLISTGRFEPDGSILIRTLDWPHHLR